jgi:MFS family permease
VYTGSSAYLPTTEEAKRFALAGAGVLLVVRIIAAVIVASLVAGLFPSFTKLVVDKAIARSPRRFILLALLGFGVIVAAPVLILILLLSFVGMGVALVLGLSYLILLILGYAFAGIFAGAALVRGLLKREGTGWRSAFIGMFVLYLIGSIPGVGGLVVTVLVAAATGTIVSVAYQFAFNRNEDNDLAL